MGPRLAAFLHFHGDSTIADAPVTQLMEGLGHMLDLARHGIGVGGIGACTQDLNTSSAAQGCGGAASDAGLLWQWFELSAFFTKGAQRGGACRRNGGKRRKERSGRKYYHVLGGGGGRKDLGEIKIDIYIFEALWVPVAFL
jgi:hypothetical protein